MDNNKEVLKEQPNELDHDEAVSLAMSDIGLTEDEAENAYDDFMSFNQ